MPLVDALSYHQCCTVISAVDPSHVCLSVNKHCLIYRHQSKDLPPETGFASVTNDTLTTLAWIRAGTKTIQASYYTSLSPRVNYYTVSQGSKKYGFENVSQSHLDFEHNLIIVKHKQLEATSNMHESHSDTFNIG